MQPNMINSTLNEDCDFILKIFIRLEAGNPHTISEVAKKNDERFNASYVWAIMSVLTTNGHIMPSEYGAHLITEKGRAFVVTDSYVDSAKRAEFEQRRKEQEYKLGEMELWLKGKTFWIAVAGFIVAVASLIVSIIK